MADQILPGYQTYFGNKIKICFDHQGPASYTTGGETLGVSGLNIGGIESVDSISSSISGTYVARWLFNANALGEPFQTYKLQWFVLATGAEVGSGVNLSAEYIRLSITGV